MKKLVSTMLLCCSLQGAYPQNSHNEPEVNTNNVNKTSTSILRTSNQSQITAGDSIASSIDLEEVQVTGKRPLTKFTSTGLVYDLHADPAVTTMSILEALRHVPMVTVTAEDEIRVKGSSSFAIYLNGRPYRVAQSDPKTVLNSIPANSISKVELITELDGRYDAEAGTAIINLITVKNAIDGYTLTLNARTNNKPEHERIVDSASGGVTFVATKGRVNLMAGYDYNWQNVLNQPMWSDFTFFDAQGKEIRSSSTSLKSVDGNYNYHTGRLMMEWTPDSMNSIYADGHIYIDHHYNDAVSSMTEKIVGSQPFTNYYRSYQSDTSGTAEANLIYRNYYRSRPDLCRFSLGYRFALDPEKAKSDFTVSDDEACIEGVRTLSHVDGHLHEHTINADYSLPLSSGHMLNFGAKEIIRLGKTRPEYLLLNGNNENNIMTQGNQGYCSYVETPYAVDDTNADNHRTTAYSGAMNYNQNISALYAAYNGAMGKFNLAASLRTEFSHNSFNLLNEHKQFSYNYFDLIPRISVFYSPTQTMRYSLTYNTLVTRPGISQLDPFRNILYNNYHQQGNPELRQSRTHSINLAWLKMSQKLIMQVTASANRCLNPIVDYYTCQPEKGEVTLTSINFAHRNYLNQSLYIGYQPNNWLRFTLAPSVTENWFRDKSLDKKCFGVDWNLYFGAGAILPKAWSIGAQLICNHQITQPYTLEKETVVIPVFYANKSFLEGRMTFGVTVNSPFAKYLHAVRGISMSQFKKIQHNDILMRGIAIQATYRISSGKRTNVDRDTSLHNEDLSTGVK